MKSWNTRYRWRKRWWRAAFACWSYPAHRVRPGGDPRDCQKVPDAIVGAGTVTNVEQLKAVTEAGAQFAISPGLTESLLKAATEDGTIPLIPGISTVSELMLGMHGLKEFKFFPAEANGGVKALQAIAGPFGHIRFCPTGGISPANYRDSPGAEQRTVHRRFLAGASRRPRSRRLRSHHHPRARSGGRREVNHASRSTTRSAATRPGFVFTLRR